MRREVSKWFTGAQALFLVCVISYALMAIIAPGFFTKNNALTLLYGFIPLAILATGQMLVMLTAGIDLSVTSIVALSSVVGAYLMSADSRFVQHPQLAMLLAVVAMLAVGAIIGWMQGYTVARLKMPAFMVTLTSMLFFSGLAIWLTKSQNIYNLPQPFVEFPYQSFLGLPLPIYPTVLLLLLAYFFLHKSIHGEWIYALGVSSATARISGVPQQRVLLMVYTLSGVAAAIAAIFLTSRLETGSPVLGQNMLLDIIGAVVIGGTSLFGGKGSLAGTLAGAFIMTMLDNGLNLLGLSFFVIMMGKGLIILIIALFNLRSENRTRHA